MQKGDFSSSRVLYVESHLIVLVGAVMSYGLVYIDKFHLTIRYFPVLWTDSNFSTENH